MNTVKLKKATSLRIDQALYDCIEKLAKKDNRSVNNFIETILAEAVQFYEPNTETKKAIEDLEKEKASLKRYDNAEEIFKDLEL